MTAKGQIIIDLSRTRDLFSFERGIGFWFCVHQTEGETRKKNAALSANGGAILFDGM